MARCLYVQFVVSSQGPDHSKAAAVLSSGIPPLLLHIHQWFKSLHSQDHTRNREMILLNVRTMKSTRIYGNNRHKEHGMARLKVHTQSALFHLINSRLTDKCIRKRLIHKTARAQTGRVSAGVFRRDEGGWEKLNEAPRRKEFWQRWKTATEIRAETETQRINELSRARQKRQSQN